MKTKVRQENVSMHKDSTITRTVNFHQITAKLWKKLKKHLSKARKRSEPGRPRVQNRDVIKGIWYVLWSGCQWKAVKPEWIQVSSSTLQERFQTWQQKGVFDKLFKEMVNNYAHEMKIG